MRNKKKNEIPTAAELRLLQVLWGMGEATVEEIVNAHPAGSQPNYKTTHTFLRIMEDKGFVIHSERGRAFVFKAAVSRDTIDSRSVQALLKQNFGGSPAGLLINLLEATLAADTELDMLESLIREYRQRNAASPFSR